jgi:aarF domain-containing kinase
MREQFSQMRSQLEEDEQISTLMAGLRGKNIDDSDFADESVVMRLVNFDIDDPDDELPLTYSPELIDEYWGRRPVAITSRIVQLLGEALSSLLPQFLVVAGLGCGWRIPNFLWLLV